MADALAAGSPVLVEVDIAGARVVQARLPEAITVFLTPPSWEVLVERLRGRGTETAAVIERRLETARAELAIADEFDHVIVNDDVDRVARSLVGLLVGREDSRMP